MVETGVVKQEAGEGPTREKFYSKDYWDLVFEQLGKRKLFKVSMVILALLYASAIYAPFIASERPYVLEAIDYKAYSAATRGLRSVCSSILRQAEKTSDQYREQRSDTAPPTLADALAVEREALFARVETMELYLDEAEHGPLNELLEQVDAVLAASAAGEVGEAQRLASQAKTAASGIRKIYVVRDPEGGEGAAGKVLHPVTTYPLWKSITPFWAGMMALWSLVLTWPLWNRFVNRVLCREDRETIRRARRKKLAFILGMSTFVALTSFLTLGDGKVTFDVSAHKGRLTAGEVVAVSEPVFPPVPMGYAETHTEEKFRPPTWTRAADLDEDGRYLYGLRQATPDPITGYMPPATPTEIRVGEPERNAPGRHLAGTDELGRDFFARLLWGGRVSLSVGILSAVLLTILGVVIGCIAGYFGGWVDILIMRTIEVLQSIPAFFLILLVMAFTDPAVIPPIFAIVIVIALIRWTGVARLVRGEFLRLREQEFVLAAKALGFSSSRTIFRHVLPNAMGPIIVAAAFSVASGILTESAISFLGFGTQAPKASWGALVNESQSPEHWWIQIFPGLVIFLTVTCYNLAGDAVRDALDPKMKN
jgi:peptide/nickel transport system permease protein